jgi:hypothetical protein
VEQAGDEFTTIQEVGSTVKVRRSPKLIALPQTTEELRSRFKTMAISFTIAGYKHANRLWIRTSTMAVWLEYVEYLLSDKVAAFHLDQDGISIKAAWNTVLSYDFNIRRLVCRRVLYDGLDFEAALHFAMNDLSCKEQYFITPTALLNSASRRANTNMPHAGPTLQAKGKGKGKEGKEYMSNRKRKAAAKLEQGSGGKGSGKGAGKKGGKSQLKRTPDGRLICQFYNQQNGCSRSPCDFVHICSNCFSEDHAATNCTSR